MGRPSEHGMSNTPTYVSWTSMIQRCTDPNHDAYPRYGGHVPPVTVCERWRSSFPAFLADMGLRPEGCTLDRLKNEFGYYKENCRWATDTEQARNRSSTNQERYAGTPDPVRVLAEQVGINPETIRARLRIGCTLNEALAQPVKAYQLEEYELNGESHSLMQWAKIKGMNYHTLRGRVLKQKMSLEQALNDPLKR